MPPHNQIHITAMHTVLRNPKLKKSIVDGINAPIGSTKRAQAQKIFQSIYSLKLNHSQRQLPMGGQGGPADNNTNLDAPTGSMPNPDFMGTVDLPTVSLRPAPKTFDFRKSLQLNPPIYNNKPAVFETIGAAAGMYGGKGGNLGNNTSYDSSSLLSSFNNMNPGTSVSTPASLPITPTPSTFQNLVPTAQAAGLPSGNTSAAGTTPSTSGGSSSTNNTAGAADTTANLSSISGAPGTTPPGQTPPYTPTGDPLVDWLHQSFGEQLGSNAFATKVLNDKAMYAELFPGVPADQLPVGASLTSQVQDLYNRLSEENNLTALNQSLLDAQKQGVTLKDDASAYIQGKDQYLNQVDSMLNNAQSEYYNNPMSSDPWYANTMQQYMNYLTTLRGRTTQRYVDYVNQTINWQNSKITDLQAQYNAAATKVTNLFNSEEQITVQQYNDTKSTLVDMYNNLAQQSTLTSTAAKTYWDGIKAQYDALDAMKKYNGGSGPLNAAQLLIVDTQVKGATSLDQALNDPTLATNGVDPAVIAQHYVAAQISKQRSALGSDPAAFGGLYNTTQAEIGKINAQIQGLTQQYQQANNPNAIDPQTGGSLAQEIQQWSNILAAYKPFDSMYNLALRDYIGGTAQYTNATTGAVTPAKPSKLTDVQNVLSDMAQTIASGKAKTYTDWSNQKSGWMPWSATKANYYKALDPSMMQLLFNTALARVQEYAYDQQAGGVNGVSLNFKNMTATEIADSIYYSLPNTGIAGAAPVDLSQYDTGTTTAPGTPTININVNPTSSTVDTTSANQTANTTP